MEIIWLTLATVESIELMKTPLMTMSFALEKSIVDFLRITDLKYSADEYIKLWSGVTIKISWPLMVSTSNDNLGRDVVCNVNKMLMQIPTKIPVNHQRSLNISRWQLFILSHHIPIQAKVRKRKLLDREWCRFVLFDKLQPFHESQSWTSSLQLWQQLTQFWEWNRMFRSEDSEPLAPQIRWSSLQIASWLRTRYSRQFVWRNQWSESRERTRRKCCTALERRFKISWLAH